MQSEHAIAGGVWDNALGLRCTERTVDSAVTVNRLVGGVLAAHIEE